MSRLLYRATPHSPEGIIQLRTGWAQNAWLQWSREYFHLDRKKYAMIICCFFYVQTFLTYKWFVRSIFRLLAVFKAHLNYTRKLKDLFTIFEKSFSLHRLARLLAPFCWKIIEKWLKNLRTIIPLRRAISKYYCVWKKCGQKIRWKFTDKLV